MLNWKEYKEKTARCGLCIMYDGDPEKSGDCIAHGHQAMGWSAICGLYDTEVKL